MNWTELENEPLESLIEFLQLKGDDEAEEWSKAAFIVITLRYRLDLLEKCTVMCRKSGYTETDAEEITNRVFERLKPYSQFKRSECGVKDLEKCFRIYLYFIARNEFAGYRTPDDSPYTGDEKVITSIIDPEKEYSVEQLSILKATEKLLDNVFSELTWKHKIIYLTYAYHHHEGRYLPKRLTDELSNLLKLAKGSIRAYKKVAFELIKSKGYGK